jgi:hypothetical protein
MKKFILILFICVSGASYAQSIVFSSISNSDTKLSESIELTDPIAVVLENSKIETTKDITVDAPLIQMSNISIRCRKLIFKGVVNQVDSKDNVNIDCDNIVFMSSTAALPVPAITFKRWNSASGNLKINYRGTFTNNRNIAFGNAESMYMIFVKK